MQSKSNRMIDSNNGFESFAGLRALPGGVFQIGNSVGYARRGKMLISSCFDRFIRLTLLKKSSDSRGRSKW